MAAEPSSKIPLKTLSSGHDMPIVALGTCELSLDHNKAKAVIIEAIKIGYRHFDTAYTYGSEGALGEAIREAVRLGLIGSHVDVFITSKLWCTDNHPECVLSAIKTSLRSLSLNQRLNIEIDDATTLDYIHNNGPAPIVHCDLKLGNILLNEHMIAHVGDFGLNCQIFGST